MAAVSSLRGYTGKNVVRGYARWFGVDLGCALLELWMLDVDVHVDPTYAARVRATMQEKERIGRQRDERRHSARAVANWSSELESAPLFDDGLEPPPGIPF